MLCPSCGEVVGGVIIHVSVITLASYRCRCGRKWKQRTLLVPFDIGLFLSEVHKLNLQHPHGYPKHVSETLDYLQMKIDNHRAYHEDKGIELGRKKANLWERKLLKSLLNESEF